MLGGRGNPGLQAFPRTGDVQYLHLILQQPSGDRREAATVELQALGSRQQRCGRSNEMARSSVTHRTAIGYPCTAREFVPAENQRSIRLEYVAARTVCVVGHIGRLQIVLRWYRTILGPSPPRTPATMLHSEGDGRIETTTIRARLSPRDNPPHREQNMIHAISLAMARIFFQRSVPPLERGGRRAIWRCEHGD